MIGRERFRRSRARHMPEISLTPLIDTALTLLVIFMITTPMLHNGLKIDLPKSHINENAKKTDDITVFIDDRENIYINEEKVAAAQLVDHLQKKLGVKKHQTVVVNGDKAISYGALVKVVDMIKYLAGVDHVVLSTKRA